MVPTILFTKNYSCNQIKVIVETAFSDVGNDQIGHSDGDPKHDISEEERPG